MRAMRALFGFGFGGSVATRAQGAVIRTDGRMMGVPLSRQRARRERGREKGQKREDEGATRWCFCGGGRS